MITVNLKIELSNLDKAMTEIKALENMVLDLSKTYPTTFTPPEPEKEVVVSEAPKTKRKPRTTKAKPEPKVETPAEEVPEEVPEESKEGLTLEALTELAKSVVKAGFRDEAKALIAEYSTSGKLSSVPDDKYDALATALKTL